MEVKIDINPNDYWIYNKYAMLHMPKLRRNLIISLVCIPIFTFAGLYLMKLPMYYDIGAAIIGGGIADVFMLYRIKSKVLKACKDRAGLLGEHTIEINEEGVKEATGVNEAYNTWLGVRSVEQDKDNIYIFLDTIIAHVVPKRFFSTIDEANEFYNKAHEYYMKRKANDEKRSR